MKKFIIIALLVLVIAAGYMYWQKINNGQNTPPTPQNLESYTSHALNISFKYPSDWKVIEGNDYPGSAQGNDYIKITKGSELIYTSAKQDCIENYTYCKPSGDAKVPPNGWPYFSTQSNSQDTKNVLDSIVKTVVTLK